MFILNKRRRYWLYVAPHSQTIQQFNRYHVYYTRLNANWKIRLEIEIKVRMKDLHLFWVP